MSGAVDLDSKIYMSTSVGIDHVSFPTRRFERFFS